MSKTITRHIVTCCDSSDSADGKPRVLGVFKTPEDAYAYAIEDMREYCDTHAPMTCIMDEHKLFCTTDDDRCDWAIDEIEIEL